MKRYLIMLGLVLVVVLAACNSQTPAATPTAEPAVQAVPTEALPTAEPTTEAVPTEAAPESILDSRVHTADPMLIDKLWQWERRDPNGNAVDEIIVPNPENYALQFDAFGAFSAQLDCNRGMGAYATGTTGDIYMELGGTTRMACPPDSLADAMMQMFGPAQSYRFEEDGNVLVFSWAAGGPVDYYRLEGTGMVEPTLTGTVWQWTGTTTPVDQVSVTDPSRYSVVFNEDGTANIKADCNSVIGTYVTDDTGALTIQLGPSTAVACPEDSQDQVFLSQLSAAAIRFFDGENLMIDLFASSGTMSFVPAPAPELTGTTWQWLGTVTPVEEIAPADSTNYRITFNDDGTAAIVADCNTVAAEYTTDGSSLTITAGASTLMACPEGSQDAVFLQQLGAVALHFFDGDNLMMDMFADGGTMRFSALPEVDLPDPETNESSGTVNAADGIFLRSGPGVNYPAVGTAPFGETGTLTGISEDGLWYVVDAPNLPDGQVWVAGEFVDATNADSLPVVAAPVLTQALTGVTWNWVSLTTPVGATDITDPARYSINFAADGTANIKADCNVVLAQYSVDGSSINIVPGPTTLAACPPDSQDQLFIQSLSNAAIYFFEGNELYLDLAADAGTMRFAAAGSVSVPGAPSVSGGASGVPFRVVSFGPAGATVPVIEGSSITALFDDVAGIVSGSAGCNTYTGTLTQVNDFFTDGPIASTLMFCDSPAGVMDQEAAYLAALGGANGYQWEQQRAGSGTVITAGQLTYALADGTTGVINLVSP